MRATSLPDFLPSDVMRLFPDSFECVPNVLRVACCVLRVACCVLRVACCVLRVACCVLRVSRGPYGASGPLKWHEARNPQPAIRTTNATLTDDHPLRDNGLVPGERGQHIRRGCNYACQCCDGAAKVR